APSTSPTASPVPTFSRSRPTATWPATWAECARAPAGADQLSVPLDLHHLLERGPVDPGDLRLGNGADGAEPDLVVGGLGLAAVDLGIRVVLERRAQRAEQRVAAGGEAPLPAVDPRVRALD